ncbi:MAG: pentapeptide repeat-containing protein [Frankiales bacterium]|nr:pentapeptide repeat-containing protein [Frankiales bacterium]
MFAAFEERRNEHELRWYVREALLLDTPVDLTITTWSREVVNPLLLAVSAHARAGLDGPDLRGADLVGKDLRGRRLVGASLRGAQLVGADLRGADLHCADVTGADLRGADLGGADLSGALFLTQSQLQSARGNAATGVPRTRIRPSHWQ